MNLRPRLTWLNLWRFVYKELLVTVAFAAALPIQAFTHQSDAFNYTSELWLVEGLFVVAAVVLAAVYHVALRTTFGRLVASLAAVWVLLVDYSDRAASGLGLLGAVFTRDSPIVLGLLLIVGCYGLGRLAEWLAGRVKRLNTEQIATAAGIFVLGVLLTNVVGLAGYAQRHRASAAFKPANAFANLTLPGTPDRDVYYIIFDRYAGRQSLADYYNFDNSSFLDGLKQQGFTVRDQAFSNYQFTAPSIASTLRMDYHTDVTGALGGETAFSYLPYRNILKTAAVSTLFKNAGYDIYNVSSWYGVTRELSGATNIDPQYQMTLFGRNFLLSDFQNVTIGRTFWAELFRHGLSLGPLQLAKMSLADTRQQVLDQVHQTEELAATKHDKPRFVFTHIISPHPPYVFGPDGVKPGYGFDDDDQDLPRTLKYTNQLQFDNWLIQDMVKKLQGSGDKPPVIVFQADEGPYPPDFLAHSTAEQDPYKWEKASTDTLKEKFGILSAYYLPDVADDKKAALNSSVNTFRFIFNNYFGASLPYLPDCSFAFDGDKPFQYLDLTARLHEASPDCAKYK